jgi:hypothetical protein
VLQQRVVLRCEEQPVLLESLLAQQRQLARQQRLLALDELLIARL